MPTIGSIKRIVSRKGIVHTARPHTVVAAAAAEMTRHRVGCLVVVDAGGGVLGIITERDILKEVVAKSIGPDVIKVAQIMTTPVVTCTMDTDIRKAEKMMARHETRHLPIVEKGNLVGMLSSRDIMAEELQATQTVVRKQSQVLHELESSYPGITNLQTDQTGRIRI